MINIFALCLLYVLQHKMDLAKYNCIVGYPSEMKQALYLKSDEFSR